MRLCHSRMLLVRAYALAAARALPDAEHVVDRWHLMENASRAFLDAVLGSMRQIRAAIGATIINPALLTAAERLQYEEYLSREEINAAIVKQAGAVLSIKEIVRRTGHSRGYVRAVLRGQRSDVFRVRESSLERDWCGSLFCWDVVSSPPYSGVTLILPTGRH